MSVQDTTMCCLGLCKRAVIGAQVRDHLMRNIKRRMTPQPLKIRADVELTCFKYDGVLHIQVPPHFMPSA